MHLRLPPDTPSRVTRAKHRRRVVAGAPAQRPCLIGVRFPPRGALGQDLFYMNSPPVCWSCQSHTRKLSLPPPTAPVTPGPLPWHLGALCQRKDQVVPGSREAAAAASAGEEGNREAHCAIDGARTCRPPGVDTGPTASITAPEGAPSAGSEADSSASQGPEGDPILGPPQPAGPLPAPSAPPGRLPWADLLQRVFGIQALQCECGKSMRVIAAITEPTVAKRILKSMGLPPRAPPLEPASPSGFASDPWLEEAEAAVFDQSPPDDGALGGA